ncbi:ankyrin repeat domain-containing protein 27 [Microdochium nivale]|nr:ankyrin repeat domain-containing protein 27 [Microdochium nivale]
MLPLNPFLAAFFKPGNSLASQCTPVHHHILLVPTTEFFLTSREAESGQSLAEFVASEDFQASHVLRIPSPATAVGGKDSVGNLREIRGKARQYNTINGRSIVIKDAALFTNKGFRILAQAQLLGDSIWYADTIEPRQWLIYYISRPLVGTWEDIPIEPAVYTDGMAKRKREELRRKTEVDHGEPSVPRKKDIKSFHDLLSNFPLIARQMQPGLDKLFAEFKMAFEKPLPPPPSAINIPDPTPDGPILAAMRKARSGSVSAVRRPVFAEQESQPVVENFFAEDSEDVMRVALETAVTSAIDIFQGVDKQQLSMLGATTELTGPIVERLIERYITENLHHLIWARLAALLRSEDLELESKLRQMQHIDISQLGLFIEGGVRDKRILTARIESAVDEFRKMSTVTSPQELLEILLSTLKLVTKLTEQPRPDLTGQSSEKPIVTINADTLVCLLLYVVIRAGVKNLQARLLYIRHFIFIDDVESGEMGYALSTFEAVLSYLTRDSSTLRKASRRNKALWDATAKGDVDELKRIMDPDSDTTPDGYEEECGLERQKSTSSSHAPSMSWSFVNGSSRRSSISVPWSRDAQTHTTGTYSQGSDLSHVFPFQSTSADEQPFISYKKPKKVSMDVRSMSSGSEFSYHSRRGSFATTGSGLEGDTSIERLCQTQDSSGESVLMMAVQHGQPATLKYLLSLEEFFPAKAVREDTNNQGTTLLSAAVQLGHMELIDGILDIVLASSSDREASAYLHQQDIWERSVAHYLFHAPSLIPRIGHMLPWRQKDKNGQTPLFALCRSYDNNDYQEMVRSGVLAATKAQRDRQPLHLDDHVDVKGNTLLHIINDHVLAHDILLHGDADPNATNEKKFTPLMLASKYSRFEMVRVLYSDPRVDVAAKELRGLTAVELAKDDDVRNKIDDLTLFVMQPAEDGRITGVVRSFFVEDATIRLVLKSGAPADSMSYTVTTCRRSLIDFERLMNLLTIENPASWMPNISTQRSPFQIPSKPSRAVLRDVQLRTNAFLRILLQHPTFSTHEMLWEFFLVPELQVEQVEQRSRLKAISRAEKVRDELEPLEDMREVEQFVEHARDMVRSVNYSTKSVARRANAIGVVANDLSDAALLLNRQVAALEFLPTSHKTAFQSFLQTVALPAHTPIAMFHMSFLALQTTVQAMIGSLLRPPQLVSQIQAQRKHIDRTYSSLSRSTRWPLGLMDDARARHDKEKEESIRKAKEEIDGLGRELRYSQQVVASELAGWQVMHEQMGRVAIRDYARNMLVLERERLGGLRRTIRRLKEDMAVAAPGRNHLWQNGVAETSGSGSAFLAQGGQDTSSSSAHGEGAIRPSHTAVTRDTAPDSAGGSSSAGDPSAGVLGSTNGTGSSWVGM